MAHPLLASELHDAVELVRQCGPYCGSLLLAVIYFLWRDGRREVEMTKRIKALEAETHDTLIPLLKETTAVISRNTTVMERLERYLDKSA